MEYRVIDDEYVARFIKHRPEAANKYDFGYILCICGSRGMHGAAVMSATLTARKTMPSMPVLETDGSGRASAGRSRPSFSLIL